MTKQKINPSDRRTLDAADNLDEIRRRYQRRRYAEDPEYRQRCIDNVKAWKKRNPQYNRDWMRAYRRRKAEERWNGTADSME